MLTQQTAQAIYFCVQNIKNAEKLLSEMAEIEKQQKERHTDRLLYLKDVFGRVQPTLELGAGANGAQVLPAVVTQVFPQSWSETYMGVNMRVFADSEDVLWKTSVQHKSSAQEGSEYWDWPEMK